MAESFTNHAKTYKLTLNVSPSAALLDFGEALAFEFARENQEENWTYAVRTSLTRSPEGHFLMLDMQGDDGFIRFYKDRLARIHIEWIYVPQESRKTLSNLSEAEIISAINAVAEEDYLDKEAGIERIGSPQKQRIGGYPSLGIQYRISQGKEVRYLTVWFIWAANVKRLYLIRFLWHEKGDTPDNSFKRTRETIEFLK